MWVFGVFFLGGEVDQGRESPWYPSLFGNDAGLVVSGVCLKAAVCKMSGALR